VDDEVYSQPNAYINRYILKETMLLKDRQREGRATKEDSFKK